MTKLEKVCKSKTLKRFLQNITRLEFAIFWCCVLVQAMVWSKFLMSMSMGMLGIVGLLRLPQFETGHKMPFLKWFVAYSKFWQWRFVQSDFSSFLLNNRSFIAVCVPFLLVLIGGLWSSDIGYWAHSVKIYLPFLILPLAFAKLPPLSKRQFYGILYIYFWVMVVACMVVLTNFFIHFTTIMDALGRGKPMPLMREHINFSRMAAFSVFIGLELWSEQYVWRFKIEKKLILAFTIFLFIAIHILSVRSALLVLYICLIFKGIDFIIKQKKYLIGILALSFLGAIPVLSYRFIPSFQNKVNYTVWDYGKFREGAGTNYSDSERLLSLQIGWDLFKQHWQTGLGSGDIWQAVEQKYEQLGQKEAAKLPHNQLLIVGIRTGIVSVLIFLIAFWLPVFYEKQHKSSLFVVFHILVFTYFWFEMPFESAFGVAFYTFGMSLFLNHFKISTIK